MRSSTGSVNPVAWVPPGWRRWLAAGRGSSHWAGPIRKDGRPATDPSKSLLIGFGRNPRGFITRRVAFQAFCPRRRRRCPLPASYTVVVVDGCAAIRASAREPACSSPPLELPRTAPRSQGDGRRLPPPKRPPVRGLFPGHRRRRRDGLEGRRPRGLRKGFSCQVLGRGARPSPAPRRDEVDGDRGTPGRLGANGRPRSP